MGEVIAIEKKSESLRIKISCSKILEDIKIGDSIATNGVCLTAVEVGRGEFIADCMFETLERSSIKILNRGDVVNLERALTLNSRLGGHLVTGDVECLGKIISITTVGIAKVYTFEIPLKYGKYVIEKGRITIDGASLTVVDAKKNSFSVSLIPHTQKMITLGDKRVGDIVNIETDIIGKYIERFISSEPDLPISENSRVTFEFLAENGF